MYRVADRPRSLLQGDGAVGDIMAQAAAHFYSYRGVEQNIDSLPPGDRSCVPAAHFATRMSVQTSVSRPFPLFTMRSMAGYLFHPN